MPAYIRKSYLTLVLIILQHQFYDLKIFEDKFGASLSFRGNKSKLLCHFFAIREFHDKVYGMF
ncbi:MAG: ClpXP protease specificity-enhancing factor SspB [Wolbachia sp.]